MNLTMSGLDYGLAPIELRERLSFTKSRVEELDGALSALPGVEGCVLLSTCNRTELYLTGAGAPNPGEALCAAAGVDYAPFAAAFVTRGGEEAARHLMAVASGMRSQIWGEDQILTQVKTAAAAAQSAGSADGLLSTLFRIAASAGKEVKSTVRLTNVPASAAHRAVELLEERAGGLKGRRALVVGNGEMGRLSARLLIEKGCAVTVTVRTYHRGRTVVPDGCEMVSYDNRYAVMDGMDLLLSATTSPHCTVTEEGFSTVKRPPALLADLALPRDIEPAIGARAGVTLLNMDALGVSPGDGTDPAAAAQAGAILDKHMNRLREWENYRAFLPALEELKQAVTLRLLSTPAVEDCDDVERAVTLSVQKTVELLAGGLKEQLTADALRACTRKIEDNTIPHRRKGQKEDERHEQLPALSALR